MQLLPDGFLVAGEDPLRVQHINISEWWRESRGQKSVDPRKQVAGLPQAERIAFLKAGYERLRWLAELPPSHDWTERMDQCGFTGALIAGAYARQIEFQDEDQLLGVLRLARPACYNAPAVGGPLKLIRQHLRKRPFTREIADALRAYAQQLEGHTCGSCRDARFEIKFFLWLDEWVECEPKRCWGEWLRSQYRKLPDSERMEWRKFIANFRSRFPRQPGKAWFIQMRRALVRLGVSRFNRSVRKWVAPLTRQVRIEPLDSNLLRNLIWCCTLCPSEGLDAALAPLAGGLRKKEMAKLLDPIEKYFSSRPPPVATPVLEKIREHKAARPAPKTPQELVNEFRTKSQQKLLAGIDPDGLRVRRRADGVFEIDGERGSYAYDPENGRIADRNSDSELEFDWRETNPFIRSQIEFSIRGKLWAGVVTALLREEACGIRLRPRQFVLQ